MDASMTVIVTKTIKIAPTCGILSSKKMRYLGWNVNTAATTRASGAIMKDDIIIKVNVFRVVLR
jgi:hypothetical protein